LRKWRKRRRRDEVSNNAAENGNESVDDRAEHLGTDSLGPSPDASRSDSSLEGTTEEEERDVRLRGRDEKWVATLIECPDGRGGIHYEIYVADQLDKIQKAG